jgi:hypothetical protein
MAYALAVGLLAGAIIVGTDEVDATWAGRGARLAALAPLFGAIAVFSVCRHSEMRREFIALGALGQGPLRIVRGALVSGWLLALVGVAILLHPAVDLGALMPLVEGSASWQIEGDAWVSSELGVRITPDGAIHTAPDMARSDATDSKRAVEVLLPVALVAPLWATGQARPLERLVCLILAAGWVIVALHLLAIDRMSTLDGALPALVLGAHALFRQVTGRRL